MGESSRAARSRRKQEVPFRRIRILDRTVLNFYTPIISHLPPARPALTVVRANRKFALFPPARTRSSPASFPPAKSAFFTVLAPPLSPNAPSPTFAPLWRPSLCPALINTTRPRNFPLFKRNFRTRIFLPSEKPFFHCLSKEPTASPLPAVVSPFNLSASHSYHFFREKMVQNPIQSLSQPLADSSLCTREP